MMINRIHVTYQARADLHISRHGVPTRQPLTVPPITPTPTNTETMVATVPIMRTSRTCGPARG